MNQVHDHYRPFLNQARDLEERIINFQTDCELAQKNERILKIENTRLSLLNEQLLKKLKKLKNGGDISLIEEE